MYEDFLRQCKAEFLRTGLLWHDEETQEAKKFGWDGAYASLKSRFTTPFAGFISKAIDDGNGRIFGTGNMEEDKILRYFDKGGDGVVDNNILDGLTKSEVRQVCTWFGEYYQTGIFKRIALKIPSADLHGNGDKHNDESELTNLAKKMGFNISISYGDAYKEGNVAWAIKEDMSTGIITGQNFKITAQEMKDKYGYTDDDTELIMFLRLIEKTTRHKILPIPGLPRENLRENGLVD
jgi:hypothetical protein